MGGPACIVLLPNELPESRYARIETYLRAVSSSLIKKEKGDCEFYITDTIDTGYLQPFGLSVENLDNFSETELAQIHDGFGFTPQAALSLGTYLNGPGNHFILGELSLHLATLFGGIIDFGGTLLPPLPEKKYEDSRLWEKAEWPDVEDYFNKMVTGMPGRVRSIKYDRGSNRYWVNHVADAEFMQAWLRHPNFHMIK